MRAWIAEVGQYPVAPEIGEEAVIGLHDTSACGVIGLHHGAHLLRIESRRQRSRAHQIADHHSEVTALGSGRRAVAALRIFPNLAGGERSGRVSAQRPDRLDEALSVAQRYPKLFEIGFR
jgi:hypothetical protein